MIFYLIFIMAGLGVVMWLLFQEKNKSEKKKGLPNLLDRLGPKDDTGPKISSEPPLSKALKMPVPEEQLKTLDEPKEDSEKEESPRAKGEVVSTSLPDLELIAKSEKLELLLQEKTEELEKKEKALEVELKAKKDFHKVKDILEKEIKELKDKAHQSHLEISARQTEIENYKKRIAQLEEKIKAKEQEVKQKEDQINELNKRIQTSTSPKPPETQEQPKETDAKKEQPSVQNEMIKESPMIGLPASTPQNTQPPHPEETQPPTPQEKNEESQSNP